MSELDAGHSLSTTAMGLGLELSVECEALGSSPHTHTPYTWNCYDMTFYILPNNIVYAYEVGQVTVGRLGLKLLKMTTLTLFTLSSVIHY